MNIWIAIEQQLQIIVFIRLFFLNSRFVRRFLARGKFIGSMFLCQIWSTGSLNNKIQVETKNNEKNNYFPPVQLPKSPTTNYHKYKMENKNIKFINNNSGN